MDASQLAAKIIPQCSILLLDKSPDVRVLALGLMEQSTARMRQYHEIMLQSGKESKGEDEQQPKSTGTPASNTTSSSGGDLNSWTSWSGSVLQGITKTIDQAPSTPSSAPQSYSASSSNRNDSNDKTNLAGTMSPGGNSFSSTFSEKLSISQTTKKTSQSFAKNNEDDWDDFGDDDNNLSYNNNSGKLSGVNASSSGAGWGDDLDGALDFDDDDDDKQKNEAKQVKPKQSAFDDLDDLNLDDDDDVYRPPASYNKTTQSSSVSSSSNSIPPSITPPTSMSSPIVNKPVTSSMSVTSSAKLTTAAASEPSSSIKSKKPAKVAVKKLDVGNDDWEDF